MANKKKRFVCILCGEDYHTKVMANKHLIQKHFRECFNENIDIRINVKNFQSI